MFRGTAISILPSCVGGINVGRMEAGAEAETGASLTLISCMSTVAASFFKLFVSLQVIILARSRSTFVNSSFLSSVHAWPLTTGKTLQLNILEKCVAGSECWGLKLCSPCSLSGWIFPWIDGDERMEDFYSH